jgi:hypothetical protein
MESGKNAPRHMKYLKSYIDGLDGRPSAAPY